MSRVLAAALLIFISFSAGIVSSPVVIGTVQAAQRGEEPPEFALFWETWQIVQDNFVFREALDPKFMTYGAIRGMLEALGDEGHTRFLPPEQFTRQQERQRGSIEGIGIEYRFLDGRPVVLEPLAGSPAARAGIRPGGTVLEVDGEDTFGWDVRRFAGQIRGTPGTSVTLKVSHLGESRPVTIQIIRALIKLSAVSWTTVPGTDIGLIRLDTFNQGASDDVKEAAREMREAGVNAIILDLRNNPGGLLREAVDVSGHFLGNAVVLYQENRFGRRRPLRTDLPGVVKDLPLVVLVNRRSASASEIFAGAIQDHQRGEIVGETTIGTGTVLSLFELEDGSAVLIGTAQSLTLTGRAIRKLGITPDLEIANESDDAWLTPREVEISNRSGLLEGDDFQLAAAIRHLLHITQTVPEYDQFSIPASPLFHYP